MSQNPLPTVAQIRLAVALYLKEAYDDPVPPQAQRVIPPEGDFDLLEWLTKDPVERDPPDAPVGNVRSFVLRLGNRQYPHMKLRISRPPAAGAYIFSVDCHDAFLRAQLGTPDYEALEKLKASNSRIAAAIHKVWDEARLPTERNYLRQKIEQARNRRGAGER